MTNYYLALFNSITWQEFLNVGGEIYGTTKNKENRAKKLKCGDKLLCYISKIGTFAGILELKSESYIDDTPVWKDAAYPVRFKVHTIISIDPVNGIPVSSLFDDLSIFTRLKNPKAWQGFFLNAFNQFPEEDGKFIEKKTHNSQEKMTSQYSPLTQTLFLIICSGTKNDQAPGSGLYREETSISSWLSPDAKASLMKGRNQALNLIFSESNSDQKLQDHPYNVRIKPGKDFGAQESDARYIPAMWLYRGRFYFNLEEDGKKELLSCGHHCLILSGLFGLVTPTEFIQLYECPLEDVPAFSSNWQQDNLLTGVLLDYITKNGIKNCIDLTSQQEYREMINWNLLRTQPDLHILHAHSKNFVSHEALPDFGIFLKKLLIHLTDEQFRTISDKKEWKSLALTTQIIPPDEWPMEESRRIDKLIRKGESHLIEYKAGLIGPGFNDLPRILNNDMKYRVMKGICSFLNTSGGEMLIGVDDSQKIIGISSELRTLKYSNNPEDEYNQIFEQMVVNYLGKPFLPSIKFEYRTIQKKGIVLIKVTKSKKPAYIRISKAGKPGKEYWIRGNCSCRELKDHDITSHMKEIGQE